MAKDLVFQASISSITVVSHTTKVAAEFGHSANYLLTYELGLHHQHIHTPSVSNMTAVALSFLL